MLIIILLCSVYCMYTNIIYCVIKILKKSYPLIEQRFHRGDNSSFPACKISLMRLIVISIIFLMLYTVITVMFMTGTTCMFICEFVAKQTRRMPGSGSCCYGYI